MSTIRDSTDQLRGTISGPWQIDIVTAGTPAHVNYEAQLRARGVALPFASHAAVAALSELSPAFFIAILNAKGECVGGFAAQARRAPLLRGHQLLRVEQLGSNVPLEAADAALAAFRKWIEAQRRVLRLSIDVFSFDAERRRSMSATLARHGFRRSPFANGYTETAVLELSPDEDELFGALHHSARRKIRQVEKRGLQIRTVDDASYHDRMNELMHETYARTQGNIPERNWRERMALSRTDPDRSRIVGLFLPEQAGPQSLIAFAWACHGDDHVYYSEAASTRATGEHRVAVAYGLMWDLILWAKRTGARLFDLGGITHGTHDDDDPLGGISDFKRYFSRQTLEVREEWVLDSHSLRAAAVGALHRRLRGG
ncbi:MAG TPA: GNAT family N-acetyltransferase [Longimicrobiales bacterium]|nr:GNAT family N-acetyltransferase [Longimicrobiales bacterium]